MAHMTNTSAVQMDCLIVSDVLLTQQLKPTKASLSGTPSDDLELWLPVGLNCCQYHPEAYSGYHMAILRIQGHHVGGRLVLWIRETLAASCALHSGLEGLLACPLRGGRCSSISLRQRCPAVACLAESCPSTKRTASPLWLKRVPS